jgi:hypothetical protein
MSVSHATCAQWTAEFQVARMRLTIRFPDVGSPPDEVEEFGPLLKMRGGILLSVRSGGARDEDAIQLIVGEGPATATPAEVK